MKDKDYLLNQIVNLSFKMRILKERNSSNKFKVKERDILILEIIEQSPGITGGEISSIFKGLSPSTISVDLKNLRQNGFVSKSIDFDDERKFCFNLKSKGASLVKEVRELRMKMFQPITGALSDDSEELRIICDFVDRTIEGINSLSERM